MYSSGARRHAGLVSCYVFTLMRNKQTEDTRNYVRECVFVCVCVCVYVFILQCLFMQQNSKDNLKATSSRACENSTVTHTHTHCLAAPGLLRNRIDGTRGPDYVSENTGVCVHTLDNLNICSNDASQISTPPQKQYT